MPSGRQPAGDEPLNVPVATKVTPSEREALLRRFPSVYSALRHGVKLTLEEAGENVDSSPASTKEKP